MNTNNLCRICLISDGRMYTMDTEPLKEFYEKFTSRPIKMGDGKPSLVCYICLHLLKKCHKFMETAVKADEILQQVFDSGVQLSEKSTTLKDKTVFARFTRSPVECIDSTEAEDSKEIGVPTVKDEHLKIKTEVEVVFSGQDTHDDKDGIDLLQLEDPQNSSDSEDDVPLKAICTKKIEKEVGKRRVAKNGVMKKIRNSTKADAREIILSKEEQLQAMLERAKSLNYIHSPYKCGLCYKGFVDQRAYQNHADKHDERSGVYECDICHMRYRTVRHLRTHVHTCHGRQYACNKCAHRSHTHNQAREHEKWHNGFTYECQLCGQEFRKSTSYLTHMRKRHPTEHVCNICGESFVGNHGLLMHKSKAHRRESEKPSNQEGEHKFCAECNIQFVNLEAWRRHVLTSVTHALGSDSSTACLECGVRVPAATLRAHVSTHEGADKPAKVVTREKILPQLPCDQCGSNFVNRSKLQAHIKRIHLGLKYNKNIVCEVCGKKCTSNASLKYHQRTHTGERPFGCALCAKRFSDRNQLRIHTRTHTGERPYCCAVCGKRFSQKPALNRHYRVHTGAKPYDCQFCAKTFSQSNSLKLHVNTVHLKLPHAKKKHPSVEQNVQQDS